MKLPRSLLLLGAIGLTGCTAPSRVPSDLAPLSLDRIDSPVVIVDKVRLGRIGGQLVLTGFVVKRREAEDTTRTHLDVTLYDSGGQALRSSLENFEPRQIPHRYRPLVPASYRVVLNPFPDATVRIEIRAHEGIHL